ncbi:MAG: type IV pilin, partial [Methanolinea sp.]
MGDNSGSGVSELVGAILLVALVITAMAIVAVLVLSGPPPVERPHVSALAMNTTDRVMVSHNGGDELR